MNTNAMEVWASSISINEKIEDKAIIVLVLDVATWLLIKLHCSKQGKTPKHVNAWIYPMTFNKAFKDVANFSAVYKAKKTGVAKQDLAREHLRKSMGSENNALLKFSGVFRYYFYFTSYWYFSLNFSLSLKNVSFQPLKEARWSEHQWGHTNVNLSLLLHLGRRNVYGVK